MLPEERSALPRVAGGAGFRHGEALQSSRSVAAVGLVAIAAAEFFLLDGVIVGFQRLASNRLMAKVADPGLRFSLEHLVGAVYDVTAGTGYILTLMHTAMPVQQLAVLVAIKTEVVSCLGLRPHLSAITDHL
jgi:hypothetical protein